METQLLSQIRILDSDQVYPFEWSVPDDNQPDLDEIRFVRHPFPVCRLSDDSYLLLEEASYFKALAEFGLEYVPVQLCPRDSLEVVSHRIGLVDFFYEDVLRVASKHPDQISIDSPTESSGGNVKFMKLDFLFSDGRSLSVHLRHSSRSGCPVPLQHFFRAIVQKGRYMPAVEIADDSSALTRSASFSAVAILPPVTLDDLTTAATAELLFPPGIITVQASARVLDVDFPVSVLRAGIPAADKEAFLKDLLTLRRRACRTTFYEGRILLLNR